MKELRKIERTMKLLKVIIWFAKLFSMQKRVVTIVDKNNQEWHTPQVKEGYFSTWKNVKPLGWSVKNGVLDVENTLEAGVELSDSTSISFKHFDQAVSCIRKLEHQEMQVQVNKKIKPKYTYL